MKVSFRSLDSDTQEQKRSAGCVALRMLRHYCNRRGKAGRKLFQVLICALPVTTYCIFLSVKLKKTPSFLPSQSLHEDSFIHVGVKTCKVLCRCKVKPNLLAAATLTTLWHDLGWLSRTLLCTVPCLWHHEDTPGVAQHRTAPWSG